MIKKKIGFFALLLLLVFANGCKNDVLPKPSSQLRLDYPIAKYASFSNHCPFEFEINEDAVSKKTKIVAFQFIIQK